MARSRTPQVNAPDLAAVVKAAATELHYVGSDVTVHRAGCRDHAEERRTFDVAEAAEYVDDWYYVAPCAKRA